MEGFGRKGNRDLGSRTANPGQFNGLWDGVVVDDKDPEQTGRVKVRIFDLHDDDTPLTDIPWATACFPNAFINTGDPELSGGFFHVPPVDALVHVMFKKGDPDFPVWVGGWLPKRGLTGREDYASKASKSSLYNANKQPSCPTWRSLRGCKIEFDDEASEIRVTSPAGHMITMSDTGANTPAGDGIRLEDHKGNFIHMHTGSGVLRIRWQGDVEEHITGNKTVIIEGSLTEEIQGDKILSVTGKCDTFVEGVFDIDSPTINLNCGIAVSTPATPIPQGEGAAGTGILEVLARLGNTINKIVTGS